MTQFIKIYDTVLLKCMTQFYSVLSIKMTQFIKIYDTVLLNEFHKKYVIIIYDYF